MQVGVAEPIDPTPSRPRDPVAAMLLAQVIARGSKLATARGLRTETVTSSPGSCSGWLRVTRMTCMRRWTGCWPARTAPKVALLRGISVVGRWYCMPCPRRRSRAAPARWGDRAPPETGSAAGCRSSMGCCARPPWYRWRSRCQGKHRRPETLTTLVDKLKTRLGLSRVCLIGDRGMLTSARFTEEPRPVQLGLDQRITRPADFRTARRLPPSGLHVGSSHPAAT